MRFLDVLAHALGNLRRQKLRTTLTVAGVAIGVFTTAVMMAFPAGVMHVLSVKLDKTELLTSMTVVGTKIPRSFTSLDELRRLQQQQSEQKAIPLDDELVAELRKIPKVIAVFPAFTGICGLEANDAVEPQWFSGLPPEGITESYVKATIVGRFWAAEVNGGSCVFPSVLLREYGFADARDALGGKVTLTRFQDIGKYKWDPPLSAELPEGQRRRAIRPGSLETRELDIVGVYDSEEFGPVAGRMLLVPLEEARGLMKFSPIRRPRGGRYASLTLKVRDRHDVEEVRRELDARGLGTFMTSDALSALNWLFTAIEAGLGFFGAIALFVALFGIANTMVMAVLERTREIGILKALGGRDQDVWLAFVTESGAIGAAGGLVGIGVGLVSCRVLNHAATRLLPGGGQDMEVFLISPLLGGGLIVFATFVAVLAGLYPAWRAARLDPVEALRRE